MVLLALAVLLPSLYGFGTKFLEFVELYRGDVDGAFAITPIANYLLASLGFLCLFGWAVFHGMFRDIERPKITMLENEAMLDRAEQGTNPLPGALAWNRSHPSGLAQGRRVNPRNRHDRG
jgi:hypothetical protein